MLDVLLGNVSPCGKLANTDEEILKIIRLQKTLAEKRKISIRKTFM